MKLYSLFIIFLIFSIQTSYAKTVGNVIKVNLNSIGELELLEEGQIVAFENFDKNFNKWYHEVIPINEDGEAYTVKPVKIAQKYILENTSLKTTNSIRAIDDITGEAVTLPANQNYVLLSSDDKDYYIHLLDNEYHPIDHLGKGLNRPNYYKVKISDLSTDQSIDALSSFKVIDDITKILSNQKGCDHLPKIPKFGQPGYYFNKRTPISINENPYEYMLRNRRRFRRMGYGKCLAEKEKLEDEILEKRNKLFASLTLRDKANYLLGVARGVYDQLKEKSDNTKSSGEELFDFGNGHLLDPIVTPELATCIAYQETYGRLNPYSLNYTSCNRGIMTSTAHGIGQITESAIEGLRDHVSENHLPLDSQFSKKYKDLNDRELHRQISGDIFMSFEIMMRILSSNAKRIRLVHEDIKDEEALRRAVLQYDQDNSSKYIINVIEKCLPCMNSGEEGNKTEGYKCYESLE